MAGLRRRAETDEEKAGRLATEIASRMASDSTDGDAFAIGSELTDNSRLIDKAIRILGRDNEPINAPKNSSKRR